MSNKNSGRSERDRLRFAYVKDQGLAMKRLLPLTSVTTTSVAFAALRAGGGVANADGFSQTNLVSDMPGLAMITDSSLVNPWGVSFANGESHLDFEPRAQKWPRFIR